MFTCLIRLCIPFFVSNTVRIPPFTKHNAPITTNTLNLWRDTARIPRSSKPIRLSYRWNIRWCILILCLLIKIKVLSLGHSVVGPINDASFFFDESINGLKLLCDCGTFAPLMESTASANRFVHLVCVSKFWKSRLGTKRYLSDSCLSGQHSRRHLLVKLPVSFTDNAIGKSVIRYRNKLIYSVIRLPSCYKTVKNLWFFFLNFISIIFRFDEGTSTLNKWHRSSFYDLSHMSWVLI